MCFGLWNLEERKRQNWKEDGYLRKAINMENFADYWDFKITSHAAGDERERERERQGTGRR